MKINFKIYLIVVISLGLLVIPTSFIFAQGTEQDLQAIIVQLQKQIELLQAQIEQLKSELTTTKSELVEVKVKLKLTRTLHHGASGDDVLELQKFLKQFPDIYPEALVTGYFGPLTEAAVQRLQEKENIVSGGTPVTTGYGQVGPKTREKLNELMTNGAGSSGEIPPGLLTAPGVQDKIATTTAATTTEVKTQGLPSVIYSEIIPATPAELVIPSSGSGGGWAMSVTPATSATLAEPEPDITPPTISNVQVTNIAETSAIITWTTDELASGEVYYASSSHIFSAATTTLKFTGSDSITSHSVNLSNLTISKTYYYVVVSKDGSKNTATSSEYSFTTLTPPLPQAPPFSGWTNKRITTLLNNGGQIQGTNLGLATSNSNYGIVWADNRSGFYHIYLAVLNFSGSRVTQNDIKVSNYSTTWSSADVLRPTIIGTANGFSVLWEERSNLSDINEKFIQLAIFDSSGNRLMENKTIIIGTNNNYVDAVWDGSGYGLSWHSPEGFLYFAKTDSFGNMIGSSILITSSVLGDNFRNPRTVWTGSEYGITWGAGGNNNNREIYFVRLDQNGVKQGENMQISSCGPDWCGWPNVYWDGNSYLVRWNNVSAGKAYLSKLSSTGIIQNQNLLTDHFHNNPKLIWSGSEYGAVWNHHRGNELDVVNFVQLNSSGVITSEVKNLIDYSDEPINLYCSRNPEVAYNNSMYALIWIDSRDNPVASCAGEIYFAIGN